MNRILLIDDDVALTELLSEVLQSEGFSVDNCPSRRRRQSDMRSNDVTWPKPKPTPRCNSTQESSS
jgi:DNA-binding response OmpR family regulator